MITNPPNQYQYVTPLRVKDVYGHWLYISLEHFKAPTRTQIPICNRLGLRRTYAPAGRDGINTIHRDNIAQVKGGPHA